MEHIAIELPSVSLQVSGVYTIRCMYDKRMYVGSSKNIKNRFSVHKSALRRGKHHSQFLQRCWNKYGEAAFEFVVLGTYREDVLRDEEQFWLDNMACVFNGSRNAYRPDHSAESREKMSKALKAAWQRPEFREKMLAIQPRPDRTGHVATEEYKQKLRAIHRAKHQTVNAFGKLWSLKDLAEAYDIKYTMLKDRMRSGWDAERAVLTPKRKGGL